MTRNDKSRFLLYMEPIESKSITPIDDKYTETMERLFAHHMTIVFGKGLDAVGMEDSKGDNITLTATHVGKTSKVMAVKVTGCKTTNKIAHITVGVNVGEGGKPVMSNDIKEWKEVEPFVLNSTITEILKK